MDAAGQPGRAAGRRASQGLNILGLVVGAVGIISIVPGLTDLVGVFGLSQVIWFVWLGMCCCAANRARQRRNILNSQNSAHQERRHNMNNYRKTAIIVGILYIIGTVAGVSSVIATGPIFERRQTCLAKVAANPNQLTLGVLLVLTMGLALAMVPALLFPIFRKINEVLAVGYVVFRGALEARRLHGARRLLACSWWCWAGNPRRPAPQRPRIFKPWQPCLRDGGDAISPIDDDRFLPGRADAVLPSYINPNSCLDGSPSGASSRSC